MVMKVSSGTNEGAVCSTPLFMETMRPPNSTLCDGEHALLPQPKAAPARLSECVRAGWRVGLGWFAFLDC
ncbi:hypothetical protein CesoFtcFv8_018089 [Champsocephalus esox]|uniref:Uncharacterized protein n=1 Tax=Champsocephalus esox TaxID=159716 RepID=A0AAN8BGU6_9TELE|nr:hypothetical protein CesoFtcFv8_018089 [Champsocephalus esox]